MSQLFYIYRAWRSFPGYFAASILTLGLGIGGVSAGFALIYGALFKPLPIEQPERVYMVMASNPEKGLRRSLVSPLDLADWERQSTAFEHLGCRQPVDMTLTGSGLPERLTAARFSAGYFPAIGVRPILGRFSTAAEDRPGADTVVVIGEGFWRARYASDPAVLGKTLTLDGRVHTIIGVAPSLSQSRDEVWVPLAIDPETTRDQRILVPVGRLRPNVTPRQAQMEMTLIAQRLAEQYPDTNAGWGVALDPLQEQLRAAMRPLLWALFGMALMVLLIACSNVTHLQLARMVQRERELALRVALGARRREIVKLVVAESVALALAGGLLGVVLAMATTRLMVELNAGRIPLLSQVQIGYDGRVLLFTFGLALAVGLLCGAIAAWSGSRFALAGSLAAAAGRSPGSTAGTRVSRVRQILVALEVGLALALLVGAALLLKSFRYLEGRPLGFRPDGVLTARLSLPQTTYSNDRQRSAFYRAVLAQTSSLPGAGAVSLVSPLPVADKTPRRTITLPEQLQADLSDLPDAFVRKVAPGYFRALGIPVLAGRDFTPADGVDNPPVVIVNDIVARSLWPGQDPVGQRLSLDRGESSGERRWLTVVGLVGNVRFAGPRGDLEMEVYEPVLQRPPKEAAILVRGLSATRSGGLSGALRQAVARLNSEMPLYSIATFNQVLADAVERPRLTTGLFGFFSGLALVLAAIGLYGLITFAVRQRKREIGIRLALGTQRGQAVRLILLQALRPVLLGVILGLAFALACSRFLASLLEGVSPFDPVAMTGATAVLVVVAFVASLLPALETTRLEPAEILRQE
jgi:putative ABC transport system permease protein